MAEVASLGISIDSAPAKRATTDLNAFAGAAQKADNASRSLGTASKATEKVFADVSRTVAAAAQQHTRLANSTGLARHELINLSRQFQDIGVSLAGGQSPFMVLLQQGSQVADIFGSSKTGTVGGAMRQVASSVAGFLTPMRAVSIGVAAGGAAAYAAYGYWKTYTLQLDDAAKAAGTSTGSLSKLQAAAQMKGIAPDEFNKGMSSFAQNVYEAQHGMGSLADAFRANNKQASTFDQYMEKAADLIRTSGSDQQRLVLLQQMGLPATMEWVRLLSGGAEGLRKAKDEMAAFAANDNLILAARRFDEGWNAAWVNFGRNSKSAIQIAIEGMTSLSDKADGLAKRVGSSSFWSNFLPSNHASIAKDMGITPVTGFEARFSGDVANPARNNGALQQGLDRRADVMRNGQANDYQMDLRKLQRDSQQIALLGQLATIEEVVRQKQNELTAAGKQGYGVTDTQAKAILNLIRAQEEMARVSAQASIGVFDFNAANKAAADTLQSWIDRKLLDPTNAGQMAAAMTTLSRNTRDLADAARVAGSSLPQLQQAMNDASNVNKQIDQFATSQFQNVTTGLTDIVDGTKSAGRGFTDLSKTVLRSLEEMLIKMYVVKPIFQGLFGGFGSGSGLAGLLGGVSGATAGYSSGGYTGAGAKYQPAGIVHAGEYVFSQASVDRLGVGNLDRLHRTSLPGFAGGGFVRPVGANNGGATSVSVPIHITNNHPTGQVEAQEVSDGMGGKRIDIGFSEAVGNAMSQPGGGASRTLRAHGVGPMLKRR